MNGGAGTSQETIDKATCALKKVKDEDAGIIVPEVKTKTAADDAAAAVKDSIAEANQTEANAKE